MNRTLIERAKCMLFNCELQNDYWAEAMSTAAYLINRSPTHALSNMTPEEAWSGNIPDLSNLKIFGCKAMVHIPNEKRRKLDSKSCELIFVGYSETTKGYRFIEPKSKKAITSRDVVFLEDSIKRNIVPTSASERKVDNINESKKLLCHETNLKISENKNKLDLPLSEQQFEEPENKNIINISDTSSIYQ
ncbi:unnamed protein product [Euphydryas editha]|uniref:Retroviral polymerase SH3-like domain-containing protein n=1 Tax=Euphydryas editha TaxID=104508 RepID=A0AAU9UJU0_EUPED|nr:unnamed protein product [Euphydryas editha]